MTDSMQKIVSEMRANYDVSNEPETWKLILEWADRLEKMMKEPVAHAPFSERGEGLAIHFPHFRLPAPDGWTPLYLAPPDQTKRIDELEKCVTFFASVIKSGESWTDECEKAINAALSQQEGNNEL